MAGRVDKGEKIVITQKMYGWSKYGGARHGIIKEELDEWYCQACGEKQVKALPNWLFALDASDRDYIRICSRCKAKAVSEKIETIKELFNLVRRKFVEDMWG